MISLCNKLIEYFFYGLFFLTPLVFTSSTSELFEFNKMWVVFGFTIVITAFWIIKMIMQKRILLCRTPLDIPILLFLLSQFVSTFLFSYDSHVSLWGYYSRFNGGFFSILSYILLYYAFVSNFILDKVGVASVGDPHRAPAANVRTSDGGNARQDPVGQFDAINMVKRLLKLSLVSGAIVALWGLPSHFGYDPTCFIFRGTFDVSCWTDAFQPKVRIFSTLGQPNWLAAYLAILIPISIAFALKNSSASWRIGFSAYALLTSIFFLGLLYSASRSGFLGFAGGLVSVFFISLYTGFFSNYIHVLKKPLFILVSILLVIASFVGTPFTPPFGELLQKQSVEKHAPLPIGAALEVGGTESGTIRKIVWQGALDIWKQYPLFGSGVETFAFSYYKYRPVAHNLTSEWDYLYNKAHNEYLNYLATTGLFGLGSYLFIIGLFFIVIFKNLKSQISKVKSTTQISKIQNGQLLTLNSNFELLTLNFALVAGYVSILISNFFGFSVVLVNLYFFLIPAFLFIIQKTISFPKNNASLSTHPFQWILSLGVFFGMGYLLITLLNFWFADTSYALGYNYNRAAYYKEANVKLKEAVALRGTEPIFKDELSVNNAILAAYFGTQKNATEAASYAKEAIELSNSIVLEHPKNVVFWKNRTRLFYYLSQINQEYLAYALQSLEEAFVLAPTDAKIAYNLGVLYGQTGNTEKGKEILEIAIVLKPDYRDAYYALGLFYRQLAIDDKGNVVDTDLEKKAVEKMQYILTNFSKDDAEALKSLKDWEKL